MALYALDVVNLALLLHLATTYRSSVSVVDAAGTLQQLVSVSMLLASRAAMTRTCC